MLLKDWLLHKRVMKSYVDVALMPHWEQIQLPARPLRVPFARACYKKVLF